MKKILLSGLILSSLALTGRADITVKLDSLFQREYIVESGYIEDMVKPRSERPEPLHETVQVKDLQFTVKTLPDKPAQYLIPTGQREYIVLFTNPGDNLTVNIKNQSPLDYTVGGSQLMDDISRIDSEAGKIYNEFRTLSQSGNPTEEQVNDLRSRFQKVYTDFIAQNPDSPAVAYAINNLEGETFMNAYNSLTPKAKESPLFPLVEGQKDYVEHQLAAERRVAQLSSGTVDAPNFTFKNLEGKDVSLSDFRGKWVIIDFWGSWCSWCIKGFPSLKKAYAEYKDRLEVIGVDCNDTEVAWRAAVKRWELPWVNIYNPEKNGGMVLEEYGVQGFPTKVIVNPEGKIVNITSGDNPQFYEILDALLKK